jgi:(S)-2-hydroxyglutarate dehydrogenase
MIYDFAVVGGGIVGLATAYSISRKFAGASILLLEKEAELAAHQTGRNSGVIHSGIYYKPGSFKARFAKAGAASMVEFCQQHGIAHEVTGKLIVATQAFQLPQLDKLLERGEQNGIPCERITAEQVKDWEPEVASLGAIRVKTTGIVNYGQVSQRLATLIGGHGEIRLNCRVESQQSEGDGVRIVSSQGEFRAKRTINCAGLHSDRLAKASGFQPPGKIVPFRGEYFELVPERRHLVKGLIYPVPNPSFPFLGVHFTRMIDGSVHAGPNAVLAWKREGYFKSSISLGDLAETLTFGGFWKLALKHFDEGGKEIARSLLKSLFVKSLQELIPAVKDEDLVVCKAGVRAQALLPDGQLVDDFQILKDSRSLHVLNAPSPAATASLEIGKYIVDQLEVNS